MQSDTIWTNLRRRLNRIADGTPFRVSDVQFWGEQGTVRCYIRFLMLAGYIERTSRGTYVTRSYIPAVIIFNVKNKAREVERAYKLYKIKAKKEYQTYLKERNGKHAT